MTDFESIRINNNLGFKMEDNYSVNTNRWDVVNQQSSQSFQTPVWNMNVNNLLNGKTIGEILAEKPTAKKKKSKPSETKKVVYRSTAATDKTPYKSKSVAQTYEKSKKAADGGAKSADVADSRNQMVPEEKPQNAQTEEAEILKEYQKEIKNLTKEEKEYLRDYFNDTAKSATWVKTYKDKEGRTVKEGITKDGTHIKEISGDKNGDGLPMKLTTIGDTEMLTVTDGGFEHSTFGSDVDVDKDGTCKGYRTTITTNTQTGATTREMATSTTRNPDGSFTRETEYLTYNSDGKADDHGFENLGTDGTVSIFDGDGKLVRQFSTNPPAQEQKPQQQSDNHTTTTSVSHTRTSGSTSVQIQSSEPVPYQENMPFVEEVPIEDVPPEEIPIGYYMGGETNIINNIFKRQDEN